MHLISRSYVSGCAPTCWPVYFSPFEAVCPEVWRRAKKIGTAMESHTPERQWPSRAKFRLTVQRLV